MTLEKNNSIRKVVSHVECLIKMYIGIAKKLHPIKNSALIHILNQFMRSIMLYPLKRNFTLIIICFFTLFFSVENLSSRSSLYYFMKSDRWNAVERIFQKKAPSGKKENYAAAFAIFQQKSTKNSQVKTAKAFSYLLNVLDISCHKPKNTSSIRSCLKRARKWSKSRPIERMAAWQGAVQARKRKLHLLAEHIASVANIITQDPLSEMILQERLQALLAIKAYRKALILAKRESLRGFQKPFTNFLRAKVFANTTNIAKGLYYIFDSAQKAKPIWLRRNIFTEMKRLYPNEYSISHFQSAKKIKRDMISISDLIEENRFILLKKAFSPSRVISSTNQKRVQTDGLFLIRSKNSRELPRLMNAAGIEISAQNPILRIWVRALVKQARKAEAIRLLASFSRQIQSYPSLWREYLTLLRGTKKTQTYWNELSKYFKKYPYSMQGQDFLIERLTHSSPSSGTKIKWSPHSSWQQIQEGLPRHDSAGRFVYWLGRYYRDKGKRQKFNSLKKTFYQKAPGSFYSRDFWQQNRKKDSFAKDWRNVKNRKKYLEWIAKYGENPNALRYLSRKTIPVSFQDPAAQKLEKTLKQQAKPDNNVVRLLFELGEWEMGTSFFKMLYQDRLSQREYFLKLIALGRWSKTLNVQVYYLRRLTQIEGIATDPFSLPSFISRILYPRPYLKTVRNYSKKYGIKTAMVYALMRQESLFRESATSRTGAKGLMQIMPRTGKWLAGMILNGKNPQLELPSVNIHLGVYYFSRLLKKNQNNFHWASIAYNGGPGRLRQWKRLYYKNDFYHFLEILPNQESRNYCRKTYENYLNYKIAYLIKFG